MSLTILSVAYPLALVRPDTAGGAEQVLGMLDEALTRAGHRSIVIAAEGSRVAGTLVATPPVDGVLDDRAHRLAQEHHRAAVARALARWPFDVVHMHGQDFDAYLPPAGVPVLVTLHVPREWYSTDALSVNRPGTWMHCVSESQRRTWPEDGRMLPAIENGVPVERFETRAAKHRFAISLGRICPEKGFHIALDAAARARFPLIVAGEVYRYENHERYFRQEIIPRLRDGTRLLGPIGFERKRRLLAAARCLLVPSLVPETSSLVAMEALASGTPVVAYPAGALADIVEHGKTGFLVNNEMEMAAAIEQAASLDQAECRRAARERFSSPRMFQQYCEIYQRLAS